MELETYIQISKLTVHQLSHFRSKRFTFNLNACRLYVAFLTHGQNETDFCRTLH